MSYYFTTTLSGNFEDAIEKVRDALKSEGFGVLTEIDVKATLKNKLDVEFYNYCMSSKQSVLSVREYFQVLN